MINLISCTQADEMNNKLIILYDTNTESMMYAKYQQLEYLIKHGLDINNIVLKDNKLHLKWEEVFEREYVVLAKAPGETFKVVNSIGDLQYMSIDVLKKATIAQNVANATIENDEIVVYDIYDIVDDNEFRDKINKEYDTFLTKTKLLGLDNRFTFNIENNEVRLESYEGTSSKVIIPNFVDHIMEEAFKRTDVTSIKLNDGLKSIGTSAFNYCNITEIVIPDTVKFIATNTKSIFKASKNNKELICMNSKILERV